MPAPAKSQSHVQQSKCKPATDGKHHNFPVSVATTGSAALLCSSSAIFPLSCTVSFPSIPPITEFYLASNVRTSTWGWSITCRAQLRVVLRESGQLEELKLITWEIEQHCSHLTLPQISITEPAAVLRQWPRSVYKEIMPKDFQADLHCSIARELCAISQLICKVQHNTQHGRNSHLTHLQ